MSGSSIKFVNTSDTETAKLYLLTYDDNDEESEEFKGEVLPSQEEEKQTTAGDEWVVRKKADNKMLGKTMATAGPGTYRILWTGRGDAGIDE